MKYVILGVSAAGINAARTIREQDKDGEIIVVSSDDKVYSRCMLHRVVGKTKTVKEISFVEEDFFEKNRIGWLKGKKVTDIDVDNKTVLLDDKTSQKYDKLLIATGATAYMPPIKNIEQTKGVFNFRDIEHVEELEKELNEPKTAVIIGAGLVGIDAAVGLIERGMKVYVVEVADRILALQLDEKAASNYKKLLEEHGVQFITGRFVMGVIRDSESLLTHIVLNDGSVINCDIAVVAAGVRPNTQFIKDKRIKIDKGIVIDEKCQTTVESIYAAGDVCGKSAIWSTAVKQGIAAAYNMTGSEKIMDDYFTAKNSMNFFDLATVSVGIVEAPDDSYETDIYEDKKTYKKIIYKDGIIYGAIFQGDIAYCGVFTEFIKNKIDISKTGRNVLELNYADLCVVQ